MTFSKPLLSKESLNEGAFLLLTCSSLTRYARMARSLAESSGLRNRIRSGEVVLDDVLQRLLELWQHMLSKRERGIAEVELAVILASVAEITAVKVSDHLTQISLTDRPPVTWVSALARRLYQERPINQNIKLSEQRVLLLKTRNFNKGVPTPDHDIPLFQHWIGFTSRNYSDNDQFIEAA